MLQKQGGNLCFLIEGYFRVCWKMVRKYLTKSSAPGMAFRSGKGAGVSGVMRSCPWDWHIWSGSDKTLHRAEREGWLWGDVSFYQGIQKGHLAVGALSQPEKVRHRSLCPSDPPNFRAVLLGLPAPRSSSGSLSSRVSRALKLDSTWKLLPTPTVPCGQSRASSFGLGRSCLPRV